MKKLLLIPMLLLSMFSMAACESPNDEIPSDEPNISDEPPTANKGGSLVVYCSRTENTAGIANLIQTTLDCDILKVEPQTPYDSDYNSMLERVRNELSAIEQGNYPAITKQVENFEKYDTIFVGYPIWHGHMATTMQV